MSCWEQRHGFPLPAVTVSYTGMGSPQYYLDEINPAALIADVVILYLSSCVILSAVRLVPPPRK